METMYKIVYSWIYFIITVHLIIPMCIINIINKDMVEIGIIVLCTQILYVIIFILKKLVEKW